MEGRHIDGPHEHADGSITGTVELRGLPHPDVIFWFGESTEADWMYPPFPPEGHVLQIPRVGEWVDLGQDHRGEVVRVEHHYMDPRATVHVYVRWGA